MFSSLRELAATLHVVTALLEAIIGELRQNRKNPERDVALAARVEELERSRSLWEAEIEGVLRKAEGARQAARAAEERARTMERHAQAAQGDVEGLEEIPEWYRQLLAGHAGSGTEEGVSSVRENLAPSSQVERARRMKFGG
jgi:hypothetical protein